VRRRLPFFALLALTTLAPATALAQSWGARLVRALDKVGRADLLADPQGKVHVSAVLPPGVSPKDVGLAPFDADTAWKAMLPKEVIALGEQHPEIEIAVGPPLKPLLDVSGGWTNATSFRKQTGYDGKGVVVGVIDTGIDILHPDFRNADGTTRIKWLMQTGIPSSGKHQDLEEKYCAPAGVKCAILDEGQINDLIAKAAMDKTGSPDTGGTFDYTGHGTHVASIAAGNGGPSAGKAVYVGVAPAADLVIAAPQTFADADVGMAAQFVFERADDMHEPCSLNVSLGSDYGAHDGSDILDRRLSRFVGDDTHGHAITVAAGNSGGLYYQDGWDAPRGIHTEVRVYPYSEERVPIYAPVSKQGRGYLWITFDPGDSVSVGLEGPGGDTWIGSVSPGSEDSYKNGDNVAGIVNSEFKTGASLVPVTNGAVVVWSGAWPDDSEFAIHLSGHGHAQMWLTSTGDLAETWGLLFKRAIKQGTINVPASSPSLLAVGCTLNRLEWPTINGPKKPVQLGAFGADDHPLADSVCFFSSAGPTPDGLMKPEISAPGGFVAGAMARTADPRVVAGSLFDEPGCPDGIPNCYVVDDRHAIAAGTSMSSPQVAGAIALLFQKDPKLTQAQVVSVLQAGARYPLGKVANPVQLGPGELDLLGALQAVGDEMAEFADPDPAKSWYALSSTYARPDTGFPVYGTVELRRADGKVAHALDGTYLTLDVQNGVVTRPLTKIRHGLYRFSVAGLPGHGGETLTVDVRYQSQSLGVKAIPIQNDVWTDKVPLDAVGGCSASPRDRGAPALPLAAAIALGLAAEARRRRRRAS
jgi:subtilisin family serine protease